MPLKKLWNSLCGRKSSTATHPVPTSTANSSTAKSGSASARASSRSNRRSASDQDVALTKPAAAAAGHGGQPVHLSPASTVAAAPRRGVLSMLSRGEYEPLARLLQKADVRRVLELGVGDGSRTAAIMAALGSTSENGNRVHVVIDQFELTGGPIALKDFHALMRGLPLRPFIIPEPFDRGLTTVAHRLGSMEAVVVDPMIDSDLFKTLTPGLKKIVRSDAIILRQVGGRWTQVQLEEPACRQAA